MAVMGPKDQKEGLEVPTLLPASRVHDTCTRTREVLTAFHREGQRLTNAGLLPLTYPDNAPNKGGMVTLSDSLERKWIRLTERPATALGGPCL